jgi:hypothetical protein
MIPVTCPRCNKVVGFEETELGVLVACPYCRTLLRVTRSSALPPEERPAADSEPAGPPILPDEIGLLQEPEPEPIALEEQIQEEPPPATPEEPALELGVTDKPDDTPAWDLDLYDRKPEPAVEAESAADEVEVVSEETAVGEVPEAVREAVSAEPPPPLSLDVLEEIKEESERERERPLRKETTRRQERERVRKKERIAKPDSPDRRILGGIAAGVGGMLLIVAIVLHVVLGDSYWQLFVSGCDLFFFGLIAAGVFILVKGAHEKGRVSGE